MSKETEKRVELLITFPLSEEQINKIKQISYSFT